MAAKSQALLTLLLISAVLIASPATGLGGSGAVGGRTKIPDVESNQEVQQLGKYSVNEYNRQQHNGDGGDSAGDLKFVKVVAAEKQVVAGIKYYLKIVAAKGGNKKVFDAEVVVQAWKKSKQLMSFAPSRN